MTVLISLSTDGDASQLAAAVQRLVACGDVSQLAPALEVGSEIQHKHCVWAPVAHIKILHLVVFDCGWG